MTVTELFLESDYSIVMSLSNTKLVIIDFFLDSCPQCSEIYPTYVDLSNQYADTNTVFYKINGNGDAAIPYKDQVYAYPTFLYIKDENTVYNLGGNNQQNLIDVTANMVSQYGN